MDTGQLPPTQATAVPLYRSIKHYDMTHGNNSLPYCTTIVTVIKKTHESPINQCLIATNSSLADCTINAQVLALLYVKSLQNVTSIISFSS